MRTDILHKGITPTYRNAGFAFGGVEDAATAFQQESKEPLSADTAIYTRYGNPTVVSCEKELCKIEGSQWSLTFASGLAAIDVGLTAAGVSPEQDGSLLYLSACYGGTSLLFNKVLEYRRNIVCRPVPPDGENYRTEQIIEQIEEHHPRVVFFEPITNPLLICVDLEPVITAAKRVGTTVVVDNTLATSHLLRPLDLGADMVVHSATKYLSGHGNLTAGVVSGNDTALYSETAMIRKLTGSVLSPDDASRLESYLKTFELRTQRQFDNAQRLADHLNEHHSIAVVRYPGLRTHPSYDIAQNIFRGEGNGAMITFDIAGTEDNAHRFCSRATRSKGYVPTLGDVDTIFLHVRSTFGELYPHGSIRLSVGIEPIEELISWINDALS